MADKGVEKPAPKVFVSYAHETPDHKQWVKSLANDLRTNGIDALFDAWRVDLGEEFTVFMDEIRICERVLLVCTPAYARKSNEGEGGVGYERSVITAELARSIATAKFICVLRSGDAEEAIPTFVGARRYIDFREDSEYQVRLEELLRSLHNAPADPEPPLGSNPFAEESMAGDESSTTAIAQREPHDEFDPEELVRKAEIILSRKDMLGWKRLVRRSRQTLVLRLIEWRKGLGDEIRAEDEWLSAFNEGVAISEPLFALAMTAIDSEIESIRDQTALVDDLLDIQGWDPAGTQKVVAMPSALAFLYHHLLGALLVESKHHEDAIKLLTLRVCDPHTRETHSIWSQYQLIWSVESLDRTWTTSWKYMRSFPESRNWIRTFFHSDKSFFDAYRSYVFIASMLELASFLREHPDPKQVEEPMRLDVPPTCAHPYDANGTGIDVIAARAIPDTEVLAYIAKHGGCDVTTLRAAWPAWFQQWVHFFSRDYHLLSHDLQRNGPPHLPQ